MTDAVKTIARFPAGAVRLPPSKSMGHRLAIGAALGALCLGRGAGGESLIQNLGHSRDIKATLGCLSALGARFDETEAGLCVSAGTPAPADTPLFCDESGSTLRFLLPVAAAMGGGRLFTGRGRLLKRPMDVYARLFAQKGVAFEQGADGVRTGGPLPAGEYALPGDVSSQFVSGLLFALPLAGDGDSRIILESRLESRAYVDLTLQALAVFGVSAAWQNERTLAVPGGQRYAPARCAVEGDWSASAFFLAAGALGRPVRCQGLRRDTQQGDAAVLGILRQMGAQPYWRDEALCVTPGKLRAVTVDAREIPDLIPPLAALCCFCEGESRIVNAGRLRLKESDRLHALTLELTKLGADITEGPDSLTITGRPELDGGSANAHGDHRIAMALAVAAIGCTGPVRLSGWQSTDKSYPGFWEDFERESI